MAKDVSAYQALDILIDTLESTWSITKAHQEGSPFRKARWEVENQVLEVLVQKVRNRKTPFLEKKALCASIEIILNKETTLSSALNEKLSLKTEIFSRQTEIAISKANIQASTIMVRGMNFIREHAALFTRYPWIIQNIRFSELAVIQARENLKAADSFQVPGKIAQLEGAVLIHHLMLEKALEWKNNLQESPPKSQAMEMAKKMAAESLISDALAAQRRAKKLPPESILGALDFLATKLELLEDPILSRHLKEQSVILLQQLQQALNTTG
jgi:hypothetical protein